MCEREKEGKRVKANLHLKLNGISNKFVSLKTNYDKHMRAHRVFSSTSMSHFKVSIKTIVVIHLFFFDHHFDEAYASFSHLYCLSSSFHRFLLII